MVLKRSVFQNDSFELNTVSNYLNLIDISSVKPVFSLCLLFPYVIITQIQCNIEKIKYGCYVLYDFGFTVPTINTDELIRNPLSTLIWD